MRKTLPFALLAAGVLALRAAAQDPPPDSTPKPGAEQSPFGEEWRFRFSADFVDRTASPCADFYQFACGGWLKANPVPPEYSVWGRFTELAEKNQEVLARILEGSAAATAVKDERVRKLGDYWASCMDEAGAERLALTPAEPALAGIATLKNAKDVVLEAARLRRSGVPALFSLGSTPDARDAREVIAEADQGGLALPDRDYYTREDERSRKLREQYLDHVARVFKLAGDGDERAAEQARAVLQIETALAKGSQTRVERRDPEKLYNRMKRAELKKLAPAVPWPETFATVGLKPVDSINVASPGYFRALDELLRSTPLESWKSYLRWTVLHEQAPRLTKAFVDENFRFFGATLRGAKALQPRWKRCVAAADRDLRDLLGKTYAEAAFDPTAKTRTLVMLRLLEGAMDADLSKVAWMDDETRAKAREKLRAVVNKVGYPDKWVDMSKLAIARGSWPSNAARAAEFQLDRELSKVGLPNDRLEWRMTPPTVNASYAPEKNAITLPAGILRPPFFDLRIDDAPNFGAIGAVIGHEITHGFDDEGSRYDAVGSLKSWWSERAGAEFHRRASCVERQFSEYVAVDDERVNGKLTLGENLADLGGLKIAYAAFQKAIERSRKRMAPRIEGFTPEQRFFLGFAQVHCRSITPEEQRVRVVTDPHAPSRLRVNGPLSNTKEFAEAFQCPADAPMVKKAVDACEVW